MSYTGILLIEDNQDDYEAIARGFKAAGLDIPIKWYKSAENALDHLNNKEAYDDISLSYNLIILDLNMPGVDGRKMLGIIKSIPKVKAIPIIVLTTSSDQRDVMQCYESGANSYIQKPVNFQQMKIVCRLLKEYWFDVAILSGQEQDDYPI